MTADSPDLWQHLLPPSITTASPEDLTIPVHVPHGASVVVVVADEHGNEEFLTQVEDNTPPREVNGVLTGRARFALGALQPGNYELRAMVFDGSEGTGVLVVTDSEDRAEDQPVEQAEPAEEPAEETAEEPADPAEDDASAGAPELDVGRPEYDGRNWGVSAALYAMRSTTSWGVGDLADLADLAVTVAGAGGDYIMLTPFVRSAAAEVARLGLTAQHRGGFVVDPLHVRPEDIREVAYLPSSQRTMLDWGSETIRATNTESEPIDFEEVWEAKRGALEMIYSSARSAMREASFNRFVVAYGQGLAEYVHAAAAAETDAPETLFADLCADTTTGAAARKEYQERITFYLWLQWVARDQLAHAHAAAREAGMRIGLVHTAPAALDPDLLTEISPYAGGVFLVDAGAEGVAEAAARAREAGVFLFADGRDPHTRERLTELGVIPQTTLWAEFDAEQRGIGSLPRESMIAVAMTQDPPTAGFLAEEHLALMNRIGVLERPLEDARRAERITRERVIDEVRRASLVDAGATERQLVEGLHRYLALTPARYLTITLSDGVGNRRPFALGGDYPDWTYPYTDGAGASVLVDELHTNARFNSLLECLDSQLRGE